VERVAGGTLLVRTWDGISLSPPHNVDPTADAHDLDVDDHYATWTEDTTDGRALVAEVGYGTEIVLDVAGAVPHQPCVEGQTLAYVEETTSSPGLLRVLRREDTGWTATTPGVLNGDPAVAARSPRLAIDSSDDVVAWEEAGAIQVRARNRSLGGDWGPAQAFHPDPARPARLPQLVQPQASAFPMRLAFVQETATGDEIRLARRAGGVWTLDPTPIVTGGTVRTLRVLVHQDETAVTWTDPADSTYVRLLNE